MKRGGFFLAFEAAPKCGKTTLAKLLTELFQQSGHKVLSNRAALTNSAFSREVSIRNIKGDLAYSTAFYWADLVFYTLDFIVRTLENEGTVIQDRYDLSILVYREINGFEHDQLLLDEYLKRGMLACPDLTVFLAPDIEIILQRIKNADDISSVDKEFLECPKKIILTQQRIKYHLNRINRCYITLDTGTLDCKECVSAIISKMEKLKKKV